MKVARWILTILTILVSVVISLALLGSLTEPQVKGQLNLYQSDLVLQASEWKGLDQTMGDNTPLRQSFFGDSPVKEATQTYQSVRESVQKMLAPSKSTSAPEGTLSPSRRLLDQVNLNLGILYAQTGEPDKAIATWTALDPNPTAQTLAGLWSTPPQVTPNTEALLTDTLNGWFRFQALAKLYAVQQRPEASLALQSAEQTAASNAFLKLLVVGTLPVLGSMVGVFILLVWGVRWLLGARGRRRFWAVADANGTGQGAKSLAFGETPGAIADRPTSDTPLADAVVWPVDTIWQVMVLWFSAFFGVSYGVAPLVVAILGLNPTRFDGRAQAYFALLSYGSLMVVGFSILYLSLRPYIPSVFRWLRVRLLGNWILWGLGGYFVALPLVLLISLLNQKLLNDQGGSNPILDIILQDHDLTTIGLLWFLVAVCAPVFEETLFRGFFLTSLTRYLPTGTAIALSGVVFAIAHLNLGDVLPLSLLGMVLGFVYLRSQNLLASILLHSLWNSGSFISLLVLGSSGR